MPIRGAASPLHNIIGSRLDDTLEGTGGNDRILGLRGNDIIHGLQGNDVIWGGMGDDILIGGLGKDRLVGGPGADVFRYLGYDESNRANGIDTIIDFDPAHDIIDLSAFGDVRLVSTYHADDPSVQATLSYDSAHRLTTISIYDGGSTPAFELRVAGHLADSAGIEGLLTPLLVGYEDIRDEPDGSEIGVPNGYQGFNWEVPDIFDVGDDTLFIVREDENPGTGYERGSVEPGDWVAYTPLGNDPITITASNGSDFIFDQVYLTSAWDEEQSVTITGYNDGIEVGTYTGTINNDGPTLFDVDWAAIDTLVIHNETLIPGEVPFKNLVLDDFLFYI